MGEMEFIGMLIVAVGTVFGVFKSISEPLNKNTKAMTVLTMQIENLSEELKEQKKDFADHKKEFESYKKHVSESQRRQWEKIDEHDIELAKMKGGRKDV